MKKTYIMFIALLITINEAAFSRDSQVGVNISTISGSGISYHSQINKDFEYRTTGFLYYSGDGVSKDLDKTYLFGSELQYNLKDEESGRLYILLGGSFWYVEKESPRTIIVNDKKTNVIYKDIDRIWNIGAGVGYEWTLLNIAKFDIGIGLMYQSSGINKVSTYIDRSPNGTDFIGIGGGIGLRIIL